MRALLDLPNSRPALALAFLIVVQIFVWTLLPYMASSSPPLDVVEGLLWGREWQLGYHKHPPLVPWILDSAWVATGGSLLGPLLASQVSIGVTYVFVFLIGRRLLATRESLIGTALLAGCYYFTWPTPEFNHNVLQMPFWAAIIYLFVLVADTPGRRSCWLWLGLLTGIGLYVKYSVVVLYAVLLAWMMARPELRRALRTPGPWLGLAICVIVAMPHLVWLVRSDFQPLAYASNRSDNVSPAFSVAAFITAQIADHVPILVLLAVAGIAVLRAVPVRATKSPKIPFLLVITLGPAVLTVLLAVLSGRGLRSMWGAPMFTTLGLLIVAVLNREWPWPQARRVYWSAVGLVVAVAVVYAGRTPVDQFLVRKPPRTGWPMAAMGERAEATWREATGTKLRYVAGSYWLAGLVALGSETRPSVVYDDDIALSPWLSEADLARDGALYVWNHGAPPPSITGEPGKIAVTGTFEFPWPWRGSPLVIDYAIRPPAPAS